MNKQTVFVISLAVNIILAFVLMFAVSGAIDELQFNFVEEDTIGPDSLRMYLDMENYGVAATLSHPIRGGAEIAEEYMDYYMLGEYADLLFLKEIFAEAGNTDMLTGCEKRLEEIRSAMPDYGSLFDKIDISAKNALPE